MEKRRERERERERKEKKRKTFECTRDCLKSLQIYRPNFSMKFGNQKKKLKKRKIQLKILLLLLFQSKTTIKP